MHGPDKQHPRILLWGDSHADHVMPMLMEAFPDVAIYQLTMAGCPPVVGYEQQVPARSKYCAEFNRRVLEIIPELKRQGLEGVVISARWPIYLWQPVTAISEPQPDGVGEPQKLAQARADMKSMFDATLSVLGQMGVRVLVLAPNPELIYHPLRCFGMGRGAHCNLDRMVGETLVEAPTSVLDEVVNRHPNVYLAQLMDFFCDEQTCFAARDGKFLYLDENHITATAARDLAGFLEADLKWLLGRPAADVPVSRQ